MTNVDFWQTFAESNEYLFEHDRYQRDFTNLLVADGWDDNQIKIINSTDRNGISFKTNAVGMVESVTYRGTIYALIKSHLDQVIHNQNGLSESVGKYNSRVKPLINNGGIQNTILTFMGCNPIVELEMSAMNEEYNVFSDGFDGVSFTYVLTVRKGVEFPEPELELVLESELVS